MYEAELHWKMERRNVINILMWITKPKNGKAKQVLRMAVLRQGMGQFGSED